MKRVLIVDDAIDLGRLLQDALKVTHPNTPITVVPSAEEALLEATRYQFDLVITDLRLPGMSGLDLIRKIRARQPAIKVILITALMPEDRLVRQKDEVHPDIFIRKPMSVSFFLEAVESLIGVEAQEPPKVVEVAKPVQPLAEPSAPGTGSAAPAAQAEINSPPDEPVSLGEPLPAEAPLASHEPAPGTLRELDTVVIEVPGEVSVQKITGPLDEEAKDQSGITEAAGLNEFAMPSGIVEKPEEKPIESVSSVLTRVRAGLGATAVILLDGNGHTVEEAGDLPDQEFKEQLIPAVMASISSGSRVVSLFGEGYRGAVQAFHGNETNLVIAPAGEYVLMIVLNSGRSALRLALAFEEALAAQSDLIQSLNALGLRTAVGAVVAEPEKPVPGITRALREEELQGELGQAVGVRQEPGLDKLEDLMVRMTGHLQMRDAEAFWESAANSESKDPDSPGMLSYDQAKKLGLVKPDEET